MPYANPEKQRQYQREWMAARRAEYLSGKSCVKCGSTNDLQIDHLDPKKKITHRVWSWSKEKRDAELAKCQVLCKPHHREKTEEQYELTSGRERVPHGTYHRYSRGCRCPECSAAVAPYWRERRANVKKRIPTKTTIPR